MTAKPSTYLTIQRSAGRYGRDLHRLLIDDTIGRTIPIAILRGNRQKGIVVTPGEMR